MINKYPVRKTTKERRLTHKVAPESNVVSLNRQIDPSLLVNVEQAIETAKQIRANLVEDNTEMLMEIFLAQLPVFGINTERVNTKDLIMIENGIAALFSRYYQIEHPLHEVTDDVFRFQLEDDDIVEEE